MLTLVEMADLRMISAARKSKQSPGDNLEVLPAEVTQARRFGKTRSVQSTALLEDYVELIADLLANVGEARPTDIARRLGVSHVTAIKTISRFKRAGLARGLPLPRGILDRQGKCPGGARPGSPQTRCGASCRTGRICGNC